MRANYNVNQPMEVLIEKIDDAIDIAAAVNNPYLAEQVVTANYNLVFKLGMFASNCKIWCRRDSANKTFPYFRTYFTVANQELRKLQQTSHGVGYHSANNATMEYLHQEI